MTLSEISGGGSGRLGFVDATLRAFEFLLPLGFDVIHREATLVRFESHAVFVNVYHGRSSYQVGLELGRIDGDDLYSLHEVLSAVAPEDLERARCQATDAEIVVRCLRAIADTIDRNCRPLLAGEDAAFERLQSIVSPMREAATLQAQFGAIIDCADRAWHRKDLNEAADLYKKAAQALDETRRRRLEYLRTRKKDL